MKYFTSAWWMGEGDPDAAASYRQHFYSIKDRLPRDLVLVHERYPLHDGRVLSITISDASRKIRLVVDTEDYDNCCRRIALEYERVMAFHLDSDGEADLADPRTWEDLGYQELDLVTDGFEQRIIFLGGVELMIRFGGFRAIIEEGPPISS